MLLAAAAVVFVIACSNVANLILARSVRREGELAVRAALGASHGALRRTLLAESLVLCGAGAVLGVLLARPLVAVVARYAARFSVRALDVTVDSSVLVGRRRAGDGRRRRCSATSHACPRRMRPTGLGLASGSLRADAGHQPPAARVRDDADRLFVRAARGRGACWSRRSIALQTATTGLDMRQVLAIDLPTPTLGVSDRQGDRTSTRRSAVASASFRAWTASRSAVSCPGATPAGRSRSRLPSRVTRPPTASPIPTRGSGTSRLDSSRYSACPSLAGRDFTDQDRRGSDPVVIVSESIAQRLFPNGDAVNRTLWWTDPLWPKRQPRRIVGVVADVDDEHVVPQAALTIYHPVQQIGVAGRLFVHAGAGTDPYALVPAVTRVIREMSANQPIERAATLEDVRADVLAPRRLNAFVLTGFAGVALLIAVVGVAGVLAFSVSARTREFGVGWRSDRRRGTCSSASSSRAS